MSSESMIHYRLDPLVIGLGHQAGNGKRTVAQYMRMAAHAVPYTCKIYSFAYELKLEFYDVLLNPLHEYWALAEIHGGEKYDDINPHYFPTQIFADETTRFD